MLERIVESTRAEVARRKRDHPLGDQNMARSREQRGGRFKAALSRPGLAVIAEFKRRSPSAGTLRERADVGEIVRAYERGGASAVSVLTEEPNFGGSLEDLRAARTSCTLPVLRKDFIVDPYQLHEACNAAADAILLIVAALTNAELASLHATARTLGLDVLVEVHSHEELGTALAAGAELVGINNRDLRDFTVDLDTTLALMPEVPAGVTVVSESGIDGAHQLARLQEAGVQAALVGESLMRAEEPAAALETLLDGLVLLMKHDGAFRRSSSVPFILPT